MVNTLGVRTMFGREIDLAKIPNIVTYPLWNVGVGINIGDLMNRKHKIKIAEERLKITDTEGIRRRTEIRSKVLQRYQKYLVAYEIYKIRLQALDVAEGNQKNISELFKANKAKMDDYGSANKAYFEALEGKAKAETDIKLARFDLEEVLGVKWEQVAKNEKQ
jgi:outer membrane protein TolC